MKFFFDTEFEDRGNTVDLISIGVVSEDGHKTFYAENCYYDYDNAGSWLKANVIPKLQGGSFRMSPAGIASTLEEMTKEYDVVEFYAYFCAYDWVCMCKLFHGMLNLPVNWDAYCRDVKWIAKELKVLKKMVPKPENAHNALDDAIWLRSEYNALMTLKAIHDV